MTTSHEIAKRVAGAFTPERIRSIAYEVSPRLASMPKWEKFYGNNLRLAGEYTLHRERYYTAIYFKPTDDYLPMIDEGLRSFVDSLDLSGGPALYSLGPVPHLVGDDNLVVLFPPIHDVEHLEHLMVRFAAYYAVGPMSILVGQDDPNPPARVP